MKWIWEKEKKEVEFNKISYILNKVLFIWNKWVAKMDIYERILRSIFVGSNILNENEYKYLEERRPLILALSDVHLGASRSRFSEFEAFLTGILNSENFLNKY